MTDFNNLEVDTGQIPQYSWKIERHSEDPYVKYLFSSFMFTAAESAITCLTHHGLNRGQKIGTVQGEIME